MEAKLGKSAAFLIKDLATVSNVVLRRSCTDTDETSSSFCIMKPIAFAWVALVRTSGSRAVGLPNRMLSLIVSLKRSGSCWTIEIWSLRYGTEYRFKSYPSIAIYPFVVS